MKYIRKYNPYHLMSVCECGLPLMFQRTPYMTNSQKVCPYCGRVYYADEAPIDFRKIAKGVKHDVAR